jgi:precorrin-8X/cobalt-precorrin-8 methylmutase
VFDRIVVVDWSARSAPATGRDSIWIATLDADGLRRSNPPTRACAARELATLVDAPDRCTLVGIDVSLGYPVGTAAALGLDGVPWAVTMDLVAESIVDHDDNTNNRFEVAGALNDRIRGPGPFWGCPPSRATAQLTTTKQRGNDAVPEWRHVERHLRCGGYRPFSSWQLLGAGAVGSQTLLALPMIRRWRDRLGERLAIWPFTTGLRSPVVERGSVVVCEVWPSLYGPRLADPDEVRDAAQVRAVAEILADRDRSDALRAWFAPQVEPEVAAAVVGEEGWILGVELSRQARHGVTVQGDG